MTATVPVIPDMPAGTVATEAEMNAVGTACVFLTGFGAGDRPFWNVRRASAGTQNASTDAVVPWDTAVSDSDGVWSSATPGQVTIQTPGYYHADWCIATLGGIATQELTAYLRVTTSAANPENPSAVFDAQFCGVYSVVTYGYVIPSGGGVLPIRLYPGDALALHLVTDSAGTARWVTAQPPTFTGQWVSQ